MLEGSDATWIVICSPRQTGEVGPRRRKTNRLLLGFSTAYSLLHRCKQFIPLQNNFVKKHVEMVNFPLTENRFGSIVKKVPRGLLDNKPNGA
jgi:hypothetical protein